ncbi:hypothetical protein [Zhongshania sp.]|uniref:hypothetical protein n=1 Tax=Zhongshania sp. TaxID=1971902 RepID=UPI002A812E2F|nr:hypothetical protein [Zhongshania sp.]
MQSMRSYLLRESFVSGLSNAVINGGFAWYLSAGRDRLPILGGNGVLADFIATAVILVFVLSLIVLPLQQKHALKKVRVGAEPPLIFLKLFAHIAIRRNALKALMLAIYAGVISLPVLFMMFLALDVDGLSRMQYVLSKSLFTGLLAGLVVMPIVYMALYPLRKQSVISAEEL